MANFKQQLVSVVAASAMLLTNVAPVLADTTISITGNGADSNNDATVKVTNTTTVLQSNTANVNNTVNANANTGGNTAKDNTNGDVKIVTGDATIDTSVSNALNSNFAEVDCCAQTDATVKIAGNGADSYNDLTLKDYNTNQVTQDNYAYVKNKVNADANTGDNTGKDNTGGDVKIYTGDASVTSDLSTAANANVARIGGGHGGNGELSAIISGNGADSNNDLTLKFKDENNIWQANDANIKNKVYADADTGYNLAKDNTGGNTGIWTGDADVWAGVDNTVNFNSADIDCGCLSDVTAKVDGNGADSDNDLFAKFLSENGVYQGGEKYGNHADLYNKLNPDANSGDNKAKDNTGPVVDDPVWIYTGDAESTSEVSNAGNVNSYGNPFELPGDFDFDFDFSFNFSALLGGFGN